MPPKTIPVVAWAAVMLIYFITCSPYLAPADSPEFVALMVHGGFAHAPGSPTTVLIYKLFAWIPGDPRLVASAGTVLMGGGALAMLYQACRAWRLEVVPSAAAIVLVGLHSQVWLVHTHPEAFAANNVFAAAILWLGAPESPLRGAKRVAVLGLLAGVGLGAHQSLILLAPVGLWSVWLGAKESERAWLAIALGAVLLLVGFSVYGTMMLWDSPVSFGRIETFAGLKSHVLREDFGTLSLSSGGTAGPLDQLPFWLSETFTDSGIVGLLLLGMGLLLAVDNAGDPKSGWRALLGTWVLCGPIFIAILNLSPQGPSAEMVKRFHVLPWVVAAPFLAIGVRWALAFEVAGRLKLGAAAVALGLMLVGGFWRTSSVYSGALEDALRNTLRALPENAVFMGQGDHRYFGFQYLQAVEGLRPDVVAIEPTAMAHDWYVDRLRDRLGAEVPYPTERIELDATLDVLLTQTERPVYVTRDFAKKILDERRMVPDGVGWRLLRDGETEPTAEEIFERTAAQFKKFEHRAPPPVYSIDPWAWSLFRTHTAVWEAVVERCASAGAACEEPARTMLSKYPDL